MDFAWFEPLKRQEQLDKIAIEFRHLPCAIETATTDASIILTSKIN